MTRSTRVQLAGRLSYREAIERYYLENPTATQPQVARATGAPRSAVRVVFARLVAAGRLKSDKWKSQHCPAQ